MNKIKDNSRTSSLTSDEPLNKDIKNLSKVNQIKRDVQRNVRNEYNYMDGILGCVKV